MFHASAPDDRGERRVCGAARYHRRAVRSTSIGCTRRSKPCVNRHPNLAARFCAAASVSRCRSSWPIRWCPGAISISPPRTLDPDEQIEQLCAAERAAVCDLANRPAFRAALIRTRRQPAPIRADQPPHRDAMAGRCRSCCGRSSPATTGSALPAPDALSQLLTWLAGRDREAARAAWREVLAGFDAPTLVGPPAPVGAGRRGVSRFGCPRRPRGPWASWPLTPHHRQHRVAGRRGRSC